MSEGPEPFAFERRDKNEVIRDALKTINLLDPDTYTYETGGGESINFIDVNKTEVDIIFPPLPKVEFINPDPVIPDNIVRGVN